MSYTDRVFSLLDGWRHLPSYQLERRADVFFAAYLPEIARQFLNLEPRPIIPEFPVRLGAVDRKVAGNRSFKIDYLVKAKCGSRVVFVELKTDMKSRREQQDIYLSQARQKGMVALLEGLELIYDATRQRAKYQALFEQLSQAGFLRSPISHRLDIIRREYKIEIAYIQPEQDDSPGATVITFGEIARLVGRKRDALSQRFAASLETWAEVEAGRGIRAA